MTTVTHAKDGYTFMRVVTPRVSVEYELPMSGALTGVDKRNYERLLDLADMHRTSIECGTYAVL